MIEPRILPGWLWAGVTLALMAGAGWAGYRHAAARGEAQVEVCRAASAEFQRRAAEESAARLAAAQSAERAAVRALQATKTRLSATEKRLKESLYALPTASACGLSGPARGLLNARIDAAGGLPESAAEPDRTDAESSADPGEPVTEADLGGWIAAAISAYDECRARIDAIRQWDVDVSGVAHGR